MIEVSSLTFPEILLIKPEVFHDERGSFTELFRKPLYREWGIDVDFVQDNHSVSEKGVIRGMHFQRAPGQAKLVTCLQGTIFDVFVDIRPDSATFGEWGSHLLEADSHEQIYIPPGFAHGFAALSDRAHVLYKVSSLYCPEEERTFSFDDPDVGIEWPITNPVLSEKDRHAQPLEGVFRR